MPEAYIIAAARTAGGRRAGALASLHPVDLAAQLLDGLVGKAEIDPAQIEDVVMGCVGQIGPQGQNIGRNAILGSSLPDTVPGMTIDRACGSSHQAIHIAAAMVMSGKSDTVVAAGVESMSHVSMGAWINASETLGMPGPITANINDRYDTPQFSQFVAAERIAREYDISRDELDRFALESHRKAAAATLTGYFTEEILPVRLVSHRGEDDFHHRDEGIRYDASLEGIAAVKPLMADGRLTAATSGQICDGAAGLIIVNERGLKASGREPLARVHDFTVVAGDPVIMLDRPIAATRKILDRAGMKIADIDLFEINEAFASVVLAWQKTVDASPERVNVHGGAIALGHPLGATGAKLMVTLVHALRRHTKRYGLQSVCIGGGQATATILERL